MPRIERVKRTFGIKKKPVKSVSSAPKPYNLRRWRDSIRPSFLRDNPLCVVCERNGLCEPATEVDHINPISQGGAWDDWSNLQALCKRCHSRKTAKENHERKTN